MDLELVLEVLVPFHVDLFDDFGEGDHVDAFVLVDAVEERGNVLLLFGEEGGPVGGEGGEELVEGGAGFLGFGGVGGEGVEFGFFAVHDVEGVVEALEKVDGLLEGQGEFFPVFVDSVLWGSYFYIFSSVTPRYFSVELMYLVIAGSMTRFTLPFRVLSFYNLILSSFISFSFLALLSKKARS